LDVKNTLLLDKWIWVCIGPAVPFKNSISLLEVLFSVFESFILPVISNLYVVSGNVVPIPTVPSLYVMNFVPLVL
jgi:hypothetical protein